MNSKGQYLLKVDSTQVVPFGPYAIEGVSSSSVTKSMPYQNGEGMNFMISTLDKTKTMVYQLDDNNDISNNFFFDFPAVVDYDVSGKLILSIEFNNIQVYEFINN